MPGRLGPTRLGLAVISLSLSLALAAAGEKPAAAIDLAGDDALAPMVEKILAGCPGAADVNYIGGGSDPAEQALLSRQQEVAPMSRLLDPVVACQSAKPETAAGLLVALDAAAVLADQTGLAAMCAGGGVSGGASLTVTDRNAQPFIQCPGCQMGKYLVADWRDGLRVLLAGMHHNAGSDLSRQDCDSDVRHALADLWGSLFGDAACASGGCTRIAHAFRPDDRSHVTATFLALLDLPPTPSTVFCNGAGAGPFPAPAPPSADLTDFVDRDPIRRPCQPEDQVCGPDGTLGLVLPVVVPDNLPPDAGFPTEPCSFGVFRFLRGPHFPLNCPGGTHQLFGKCFTPVTAAGSPACINTAKNWPIFTPRETDSRSFNLLLRGPDGVIQRDARGRQLSGSFYRLHTTTTGGSAVCTQPTANAQIACLTQAAPCSVGVAGLPGAPTPGTDALAVSGVAPTLENVRRLATNPGDSDAYPLARGLYLNTLAGFTALKTPSQGALAGCFSSRSLTQTAAASADLIALDGAPVCVDFDERQCGGGAILNANACDTRTFDLCPSIDSLVASPLQTGVGGSIQLAATASDPDGPMLSPSYLWSATSGNLSSPESPQARFTCTEAGAAIITLTVWDGRCADAFSVVVTCTAPH